MAKYGLAQMDLNLLVQLSLAGLIDAPEHHLSNLLRSQQPIEARTRKMLAESLDGRATGSRLKVSQTANSNFVRRFRSELRKIEIGRRVAAAMTEDGKTYDKAVEGFAVACGRSEKWIEACHTKANKLARWIAECRKRRLNHSGEALEMAFVYAHLMGMEPGDALKLTIEQLAETISQFDAAIAEAEGIRLPASKQ